MTPMHLNGTLLSLLMACALCTLSVASGQTISGKYEFTTVNIPGKSEALVLNLGLPDLGRYLLSARSEFREDFAITAGIAAKQEALNLRSAAPAMFKDFRPLLNSEYTSTANGFNVRTESRPNSVLVIDVALPLGRKIVVQVNEKVIANLDPAEGFLLDTGTVQSFRISGVHALLAYLNANRSLMPGKPNREPALTGPTSVDAQRLGELITNYVDLGQVPAGTTHQGYLCTLSLLISQSGDVLSVSPLPSGFSFIRDSVVKWKFRPTSNGLKGRVPIFITPEGELVSPLSPGLSR